MTLPANGNAPLNNPSHFTEHQGLPRGIVAYKMGTGSVAIGTTNVEFMRLTNVPLTAGRLYLFTLACRAVFSAANSYAAFRTPGTTVIAGTSLAFDVINNTIGAMYTAVYWQTPFTVTSDGTFTIPVHVLGTAAGTAYADNGSHLRIEDIGPVRGGQ